MQDHVMRFSQGRSCLRVLPMSGAVCQCCAPDPRVRAADNAGRKHRGDGVGETKEAAQACEGREDLDACKESGEIERPRRRHNITPSTNDDQRRGATGRGQPDDSTSKRGRGEE